MKLSPIQAEHIIEAASIIDEQGIPKDFVWSQYYVVVNGKEYQFKHLVRSAYKISTGNDLKFESNDSSRNYVRGLGFNLSYYVGGYNFFTKEELEFYVSIHGDDYRKTNKDQEYYGQKLYPLNAKLKYWLEQIKPDDFKIRYDGRWLGANTKVVDYLWPRIYKNEDKDIFFNVEVAAYDQFIGFKLDGYYSTQKKLPDDKISILDNFKNDKSFEWYWHRISFKELENYSWERLINECKDYLNDQLANHDYLKRVLNNEQNVPLPQNTTDYRTKFSFEETGSNSTGLPSIGKRKGTKHEIELEFKHNDLQSSFLEYLQDKHGKEYVKRECNAYGASRIDIVRKTNSGYVFYEIKTYDNLRTSIREAIGQLFEYCLYPNVQEAEKLILVSDVKVSPELKDYLNHLKAFINIPFSYIQFDMKKKEIVEEI